ncbi:MAG TPA: hypothetical protein VGJ91_20350 [Polyangiaceae bacterium]
MNKAQREAEAARLARWCLSVTDYLATLDNDPSIGDFADIVNIALKAGSVAQLKSIKRDLTEWVRGLTLEQQRGLNHTLQSQIGASLGDEDSVDQALVDEVLARGEIRTESEYRLVNEWMGRLGDASEPAKIAAIDALLARYGTRLT